MGEFFTLSETFLSHRKRLYIALATLSLLCCFFWAPQIRTSTLWFKPEVHLSTDEALPYTAAIVYLVTISRIPELLESLASVHRNLPGPPWPIVLCHTGEFDHDSIRMDFISRIRDYIGVENASRAFSERIEFVKLDWQLPKGISADKEIVDPVDSHRWPDYHHMCSFFATEIFSLPRLRDVTYHMRMDSDSLFTDRLCYDPFEYMHVRRRSYGYLSIGSDPREYTEGMWPFVHNYVQAHASVQRRLRMNNWEWSHKDENGDETLRFKGYDTNFEVVELGAFSRPDVKEWLDALQNYPEGIFKWRWGDAQLRYATVQMFFEVEEDTEQLCGVRYSHQSDIPDECPCVLLHVENAHRLPGA